MNAELAILLAFLLALISVATADEGGQEYLEELAIGFLVLCIVILLIALIVPIVLYRRSRYAKSSDSITRNTSKYQMSDSSGYQETNTGVYGNYTDPQPTGSIYLPLEKKSMEGNGYAHLEGSSKTPEGEGPHTYETLKNSNTFKNQENTYDNPGATFDEDKKDDSGSEHDYEMADASVSVRGPAYENPVPLADKEDDTSF